MLVKMTAWVLLTVATVVTLIGVFFFPEARSVGLVLYACGALTWALSQRARRDPVHRTSEG